MKTNYSYKNHIYTFFLLAFLCTSTYSFGFYQDSFKEFKGLVVDKQSKEPLAFATLIINNTQISTITNTEGEFLLKVPNEYLNRSLNISFLGYTTKEIPLSDLNGEDIQILMDLAVTQLSEVNILAPKDALSLVKAALDRKGNNNYYNEESTMTAFYRETIKNRRRDASLSEAVVEIYKQPYNSNKADIIKLIKARKNTNYNRLDTLALKLQGGPFTALYTDFIKYSKFVFTDDNLPDYDFSFDTSTEINNKMVYVIKFKPKPDINYPLYYGKLYIDAETFALTSAVYNLNVEDREKVAEMFVKKKPYKVTAYPTEAAYRVDYRTKNGKWFYSYSNIQLTFKVSWKGRLFNSVYTLSSEMAITDLGQGSLDKLKPSETLRPNIILSDEASGFSDPDFWGEYNIIEPEKSIESAIEKINKQLKKS